MVKRPMIWTLFAYLTGMYLAWQMFSLFVMLLISYYLYHHLSDAV
jgi:hypothetical protein